MRSILFPILCAASLALSAGACAKKDGDKNKKDNKAKPSDKAKPTDKAKPGTAASKPALAAKVTINSADDLAKRMQQCVGFINAHDAANMGSCYAEDTELNRVDVQPNKPVKGRAELMKQTQMYWKSFSETNLEPHMLLVKDKSELVIVGMGDAKHTGEFFGMKATGNRVGMMEAIHSRFNGDGQIVREDVYFDQMTWMLQLADNEIMPHRPPMNRTGKPPKVLISKGDKKETDNLAIVQTMHDAMNAHDQAKVMALYHPDATFSYLAAHEDSKGTEKIGKQLTDYFVMSTDVKFTPEWKFAAGDYVVARVNSKGTNNGPLPEGTGPATNKTFDTNQLDLYELKDGKVSHQWIFSNGLAAANQLGLVDMEAMMKPPADDKPGTPEAKPGAATDPAATK